MLSEACFTPLQHYATPHELLRWHSRFAPLRVRVVFKRNDYTVDAVLHIDGRSVYGWLLDTASPAFPDGVSRITRLLTRYGDCIRSVYPLFPVCPYNKEKL